MQQKLCWCQQSRVELGCGRYPGVRRTDPVRTGRSHSLHPPFWGRKAEQSRRGGKMLKARQIELHIGIIMTAILRSCLITLK